jgi:hypothetical protein
MAIPVIWLEFASTVDTRCYNYSQQGERRRSKQQ